MITAALSTWLGAFVFTSCVEAPIYVAALRSRHVQQPLPWRHAILWALAASALTHPFVWFAFPAVVTAPWFVVVLLAELFAVTVEAVWLARAGLRGALWWSLLANASSVAIGEGLRAVGPPFGL